MHDTIIVGAGVAGLAAAAALRVAGRSALVVEARNRVGGRVHTDHTYGHAELGAEFIHGDRATTWELVRAAGLRTSRWPLLRRLALGGRMLPEDDATLERARALVAAVDAYSGPERSVAELLRQRAPADDPALVVALQWLANIEGADPARLSALALAREHATTRNGVGNFHILAGYDRVVARMAAGLNLRLGVPVERVTWSPGRVELGLPDGERIAARHVIITVPLGVLQAGCPLFDPPLPAAKQQAIAAIAMGHVSKLLLWFDRRLWGELEILSTDGRVATWWDVASAAVPTLMGYTGGPPALALAALGEQGAIDLGLAELAQLLGVDLRPHLLGGRLADWSRDPWSGGAYSYSPVGMGDARAALAAPLEQTLFFAGEATLTDGHLATVHGAIESGRRAAQELLEHL